jgi:uncharacterized protein YmfQ (DUF2313 family)
MAELVDRYIEQLKQLLPPGSAYSRDPGAVSEAVLGAIADELVAVHNRAQDVIDESDPRTTEELITDWERVLGLPDCVDLEETLEGRRNAVVGKLVAIGGQSRQYFIDIAAAVGYEITIDEFGPFRVSVSAVSEQLMDEGWWFTWRVNGPSTGQTHFRAGLNRAGDPLTESGEELLECRIRNLKPAHTVALFAYVPLLYIDFTLPLHGSVELSYTRTGPKGYFDSSGALQMAAANLWPLDYDPDALTASGRSIFPARTNYFLNSLAPVTQTVDLTGELEGMYTVAVTGSGSAEVAANTAIGSGFGAATEGSPVTFTMDTAGTVDVTIVGSVDACQLEGVSEGWPTPIIETEGVAVTRGNENATIPVLGDYWDAAGSTITIRAVTADGLEQNDQALFVMQGAAGEQIYIGRDQADGRLRVIIDAGGVNQASGTTAPVPDATEFIISVRVSEDNIGISMNGSDVAVDSLATIPVVTNAKIGEFAGLGTYWNGVFKSLRIEPTARSDAGLIELSSI